jgi:uncharacterized Zn-finger protein
MLHEVHCKKCGEVYWADLLDINLTETDPITVLDRLRCPGNHVELCSPSVYLEFTGKTKDGHAPSDEEWLKTMTEHHGRLYSNSEVGDAFSITGFSFGMAFGTEKATGNKVSLDFTSSPSGRTRYYWVI